MNKAKINYWVDLVIALAFVLSAISGIVFLFPVSANSTVFGVPYRVWDQIHIWGSLLMVAGVLAHLVLHWKWIVAMTKKTFLPQARPAHAMSQPASVNEHAIAGRRHFLRAAGVSTVAVGAAAIGYRSIFSSEAAAAGQTVAQAEAAQSLISIPLASTATSTSAQANQVVQPAATTIPVSELTGESIAATEPILVPTSTPAATAMPVSTSVPTATAQSATVQQTTQRLTVACPKGLTYDKYPGRCRHYVDRDGDGYCDLSIPTAG